jgi:hypothetical protein
MQFTSPGDLSTINALTSAALTPYGTPLMATELDDKIYLNTTSMIETLTNEYSSESAQIVSVPGVGKRVLLGAKQNINIDQTSSVVFGNYVCITWRIQDSTNGYGIGWQWMTLDGEKLSGGATTLVSAGSTFLFYELTSGADGVYIWYRNASAALAAIRITTANVVTTLTVPSVSNLQKLAVVYSSTDTAWWITYYVTGPNTYVSKYTISGSTVSAAITPVSVSTSTVVSLDIIRTTNYILIGALYAGTSSHEAKYYNTSLTLQATKTLTTSASVDAASVVASIGFALSSTTDSVYALVGNMPSESLATSSLWNIYTYVNTWEVNYTGSPTAHLNSTAKHNFLITSKPFVHNGALYASCVDIATNSYQTSALICFLNTATARPTTAGANDCAFITAWSANDAYLPLSLQALSNIYQLPSGTRIVISGGRFFIPSLKLAEFRSSSTYDPGGIDANYIHQLYYSAACVFIYDTTQQPQMRGYNVGTSKVLITNNVYGVDGNGITPGQLWPNQTPLIYSVSNASGAIVLNDTCIIVYERIWTDSYGNRRRVESAPIQWVDKNVNYERIRMENNSSHSLLMYYPDSTNKSITNIYRTELNGSILYFDQSMLPSDTYKDIDPDNNVDTSRPLASSSGELPAAIAPSPRASCMWKSRIAILPADNSREIWYTGPIQDGEFPTFRIGLNISIPQAESDLTAIISMDGVLYAFTKNQVFTIYGDPAGATGENSTLSNPEIRFNGVGCRDPHSLVLTPKGIVFHSEKGFYLILRNQELVYIGDGPFEDRARTVLGHHIDSEQGEVSFLFEDLDTAIDPNTVDQYNILWTYDYVHNEWYRAARLAGTNDAATHISSANDQLLMVAESFLYYPTTTYENVTSYTSPWIRLGSIQGYQRLYNILLKVENAFISSRTYIIDLYTDYSDTAVYTWNFAGSTLTSNNGTIKLSSPKQKCEAFKIRIYTEQASNPASSFTLQGITAEIGVKDTTYKQYTGPNNT